MLLYIVVDVGTITLYLKLIYIVIDVDIFTFISLYIDISYDPYPRYIAQYLVSDIKTPQPI